MVDGYRIAVDRELGLLVMQARVVEIGDEDRFIEAIDALYQNPALHRDLVMMTVVHPQATLPSATFRQRIATSRARTFAREKQLGATRRTLGAVVSSSVWVRGLMTALDWLHPPGPELRQLPFGSVEEAVRWAERERGEPLPQLLAMLRSLD